MAATYDPETRKFVREATIGMIVISGLLALIIIGLARRFGAWQKRGSSADVQSAEIVKRLPRGRAFTPPRQRNEDQETAGGGPTPREAPRIVRSKAGTTAPAVASPATADTPGGRPSSSPARIEPRSTGFDPAPKTLPNQQPEIKPLTTGPDPPDIVPKPFRPTPAVPTATPREDSPKPRVADRDQEKPDPNWVIRVDDTLWKFCDRNYGDPQWFRAFHGWLAKKGLVFEELGPGRVLKPPTKADLRVQFPNLVPEDLPLNPAANLSSEFPGSYVTSGRESLFDIAGRHLGQAARYVEIIQLNGKALPNEIDYLAPLPAGISLRMPGR